MNGPSTGATARAHKHRAPQAASAALSAGIYELRRLRMVKLSGGTPSLMVESSLDNGDLVTAAGVQELLGRYPGLDKNGIYGYPTALVWNGTLYVTCSINKEMIAVMHVSLSEI